MCFKTCVPQAKKCNCIIKLNLVGFYSRLLFMNTFKINQFCALIRTFKLKHLLVKLIGVNKGRPVTLKYFSLLINVNRKDRHVKY